MSHILFKYSDLFSSFSSEHIKNVIDDYGMSLGITCAWLYDHRRYKFRFLCATDRFATGYHDKCASSLAKTSLHTTSQTLQINTIIPLKSRKNFNVYLPAQGVFLLKVNVCMCIHKIHAGAGT